MPDQRIVYMDGEFVPWEHATVHMMSHSFSRGSAIFEVIGLYETGDGPAVFRLDEHMDRLFRSAALLEMELPLSKPDLVDAVKETVRRNGLSSGFIKVMCYYPHVIFDLSPPVDRAACAVFAIDPARDFGTPGASHDRGISLCISGWRKLDPGTVPTEAKATANYLNGMMARLDARKRGFDRAVMVDGEGFIAEGGTSSVFVVKDGRIMTPAPGVILKSITRKSILPLADALGIDTEEGRLHPHLLNEADEVFMSSTTTKVLPVTRFEERRFEEAPGPVSRALDRLVSEVCAGRDERFRDWLFFVR